MDEFKDWRLRELLLDKAPKAAALLLDELPLQRDFFDRVVETIVLAPLVPTEDYPLAPQGLPDGADSNRHMLMVRLAAHSLVRSLARSGFLAFAGMPSEALGVHRRTLESFLDLELLLEKPALVLDYQQLIYEPDRSKSTKNPFYAAKHTLQRQLKDPGFARNKLSPLQQSLADRGQYATLNIGAHAGGFHAITGIGFGGSFGFFDPQIRMVKYMGFRFPWETLQLLDALRPKLTWIDGPTWTATVLDVQKEARVIENAIREADDRPAEVPPWSSLLPLPSQRRST